MYGLRQDTIKPNDWIAGSFTPLKGQILQPDGNWETYLPVIEYQNNGGYDRYACVTYSYLNTLEILHLRLTGKEINFSDRFLAKASNTTSKGNYLSTVAETAEKIGLLSEKEYPDVKTDWNDYYKDLDAELLLDALKFQIDWELYHEWVTVRLKNIKEALLDSPLQVTVCYASGNGLLNPTGRWNHAVTLYGVEDGYLIFDHYTQTRKKYSLDYEFGVVLKPTLIRKNINMLNLKQNYLYLLVEGKEQKLAVAIDNKLVIYDEKIDTLINSASRANKYLTPIPVTLAQWNSVEKVNGKGGKI